MFYKKGVLRNFTKFTGKHLCQSFFFNKVAGLRPATLLMKRLWHRCFPVNFVKVIRTSFLQNTSGRLLLKNNNHLFNAWVGGATSQHEFNVLKTLSRRLCDLGYQENLIKIDLLYSS